MNRRRQMRYWSLPVVFLVVVVLVVGTAACGTEAEMKPTRNPTALDEPVATVVPLLPDLVVTIQAPGTARPGEALGDRIVLKITNVGQYPARDFSVGLYFSADEIVDQRDPLLLGGREFVKRLGPGEQIVVQLNGKNTLPENALPEKGFLGVIVDEYQTVAELDEGNNTAYSFIQIVKR